MPHTSHLFMIKLQIGATPEPSLPDGLALRTYRDGDEVAWLRILRAATGEVWSDDAFDRCVLSDIAFRAKRLFFVTHNEAPVGTAGAFQKLCHGDRTGYVHMAAVLPRFQRRGIGSALLRACLRYFVEQGWHDAVLDTDISRLPAIRLYLAHGFVPFPENDTEVKSWREVLRLLGREDLAAHLETPPGPKDEAAPPRRSRRPPPRQRR